MLALGAALVVASLARQRGVPALDSLWAEDGAVFLERARSASSWSALTSTYAGYVHLLPRLTAEAAAALPLRWSAIVLSGAGALATALAGLAVYAASAGHVRSRPIRVALACLPVLHPIAGSETLNTVALSQWHLAYAAFWVAVWRPESVAGRLVAAATLFVAILSAPLSLAVIPLLVVRMVLQRESAAFAVVAPALLAAAIQGAVLLTADGAAPGAAAPLTTTLVSFAQRVVTHGALGYRLVDALYPPLGGWLPVAVGVLVGAGLVAAATVTRDRRALLAWFCGASVLTFVVAVVARGAVPAMVWQDGIAVRSASRYALVPALLLASAGAVILDGAVERGARVLPAVVLAAVAGVVVVDFPAVNPRSNGPTWSASVSAAVQACSVPRSPGEAHLLITPRDRVPPWEVTLRCHQLVPEGQA